VVEPMRPESEFDLAPFQPASPPPPAPEKAEPERRTAVTSTRPASSHHVWSAPEAARAAPLVAQAPQSNAPVDLTADTVVTGTGAAYVGGATTATGTSASPAGEARAGTRMAQGTSSTSMDRSTPVTLGSGSWSCPWPPEADAEQIDEQTVILRVVVAASGDAESAAVVSDPGHGFGAAALACAMRTRFAPARDPRGAAMRATSPPIRVRFTR
jgi:protein TonB